jgi:hypothetical protein
LCASQLPLEIAVNIGNKVGVSDRKMKTLLTLTMFAALLAMAQADDKRRERHERREHHNYILERQQAYQVQGVPTSRLIIGKREIDVYPNGLMFERNNVVGVRQGR